ncbi:hypothetical protein [Bordetella genomosp. 11]|uniref:Uncharacterized protein n=1 Tax=Bordetella genomosp. 11 TaxID=1416808 RepID=A0A261UIY6_9BORD|nr:hypothetical protein [Bordetella genomosp. 11]OZI61581.1 hypothetical protein CAL28_20065 [Bordetella genomosp. 11]
MATAKLTLAALAAFVVGTVAGQWQGQRDTRLLQQDDIRREKLIARNCGPHSTLWRNAANGQYGCLYVNRDGQALIEPTFDAPVLSARR